MGGTYACDGSADFGFCALSGQLIELRKKGCIDIIYTRLRSAEEPVSEDFDSLADSLLDGLRASS